MTASTATHQYRAVIFDHDGTLVDSEGTHCTCWNTVLAPFGATLTMANYLSAYNGLPTIETAKRLLTHFQINSTPQALYDAKIAQLKQFMQTSAFPLLPHVRTTLKSLFEQNIPMAIASGANRYEVEHSIRHHQLAPYFQITVTKTDVPHAKPAPDCYLSAAKELNLPPEACIAIEDSDTGQQSAEAAGMLCLRLSPYHDPGTYPHMQAIYQELQSLLPLKQP